MGDQVISTYTNRVRTESGALPSGPIAVAARIMQAVDKQLDENSELVDVSYSSTYSVPASCTVKFAGTQAVILSAQQVPALRLA